MRYLREMAAFLGDIGRSWTLILELTKKDFKVRYLGSYFGIAWAFVQPIVTILIFWFVFQWGLRSNTSDEYPFILWLINGLTPWFFVSESIISATRAVVESSYLVKKVVFKVSILPVIKILSAAIVHFIFVFLVLLVTWLYGHRFSLCNLQLLYFFLCALCLAMAFGWIFSSLMVFIRDVGQIVAILFQFGFWLTPIVWRFEMIPVKYRIFFNYNPFHYIITGYRNSLLYHRWFWQNQSQETLNFWLITGTLFCLGIFVFRRSRPHFADVL